MRLVIAVVLAAFVLAPAAVAAGGGSVLSGYGGEASPTVVKVTSGTKGQSATQGTGDTLPFTGADLGLFLVAGSALVAVGLVVRRLGRENS